MISKRGKEMVKLNRMNRDEYDRFLSRSVLDYAADKVMNGAWREEEATRLSEESFQRLLPEGLETKGAYLYSICDSEQSVGYVWIQISEHPYGKSAFLYDILIYEAFQSQGYGKQTMAALDVVARELGADKISLHVFGNNPKALKLYEKSGYMITDYNMSKSLN